MADRILQTAAYRSRAYAFMNLGRREHFNYVTRRLPLRKGDTGLEIGCGRGFVVKRLSAAGYDARGVDINPHSVNAAASSRVARMSATALDFADATFDHIYSFHTIEHVADTGKFLEEAHRALKPGGRFFVVYPAEPIRGLFAIGAATVIYKNPLKCRQIHVHKFTPRRLEAAAGAVGFKHIRSEFKLLSSPQYLTLLQKGAA